MSFIVYRYAVADTMCQINGVNYQVVRRVNRFLYWLLAVNHRYDFNILLKQLIYN